MLFRSGMHSYPSVKKRLPTCTSPNLLDSKLTVEQISNTTTAVQQGILMANTILKKKHVKLYAWKRGMKNYVTVLPPPLVAGQRYFSYSLAKISIMRYAERCQFCTSPSCCNKEIMNIPSIMRRVMCGNMIGAYNLINNSLTKDEIKKFENDCWQKITHGIPVEIEQVISGLKRN